MRVFKFGGGIIRNAESIRKLPDILSFYDQERIVIVLSAINKSTNNLENLISDYYHDKKCFHTSFDRLKDYHINILLCLGFDIQSEPIKDLRSLFNEIICKFEDYRSYPYHVLYDQIVSYGELISCLIVSNYMKLKGIDNEFVDARSIIKTNSKHRFADVNFLLSEKNIKSVITDRCNIYITQGFVGSDEFGLTTTLGREGSDYTAAVLAHVLNADEVVFWKDVPGIFNADPKYYEDAVLIPEMNHTDAKTLTDLGAKVLHHKTIKPLEDKNIPVRLNPFQLPVVTGSYIRTGAAPFDFMPIIVHRFNKVLLNLKTMTDSPFNHDEVVVIKKMIKRQQLEVNYDSVVNNIFYICLNHFLEPIIALRDDLRRNYRVDIHFGVCMVKIRHGSDEIVSKILEKRELLHRGTENEIIYLFY